MHVSSFKYRRCGSGEDDLAETTRLHSHYLDNKNRVCLEVDMDIGLIDHQTKAHVVD
jgi:hypothetical protein